jgi:hypothetical protein
LVYDNYNGLVVGFSPNEKPSVAILSLLMLPDHVTLCFLQGKGLPDPQKLLKGSGNVVRHLRLESPATLDEPAVLALIKQPRLVPKSRSTPNKNVNSSFGPFQKSSVHVALHAECDQGIVITGLEPARSQRLQ